MKKVEFYELITGVEKIKKNNQDLKQIENDPRTKETAKAIYSSLDHKAINAGLAAILESI